MKEIQLSQGAVAFIDEEDLHVVGAHKWVLLKCRSGHMYAVTGRGILMHRVLMNAPKGMFVDHKDGNGLNNVRSNLRLATVAQNNQNSKGRKTNKTGFRCVLPTGRVKSPWVACVQFEGKRYKKVFPTPEAAVQWSDAMRVSLHGQYVYEGVA